MVSPRATRTLPPNPSIEQHKKQAKELLAAVRSHDLSVAERLRATLTRLSDLTAEEILGASFTLSDAQFIIAREHGFDSWPKFQRHVDELARAFRANLNDFLIAGTPDPNRDHRVGTTQQADALLDRAPELRSADIYAASIVGDGEAVKRFLVLDKTLAARKGGPHDWEPLQYVCFSRFLRLHPERTDAYVLTARVLLEHGANPNAFFMSNGEHESVLYGAGGVARNPALTKLLLESGADVNDDDLEYHAAECDDDTCLMLMVEYGLDLNRTGTSLLRKLDFDRIDTVKRLLDAGANPNAGLAHWGKNALHQAIMRGRNIEFVRLLLHHGVDLEAQTKQGKTALALAARAGRNDIMRLLKDHGANTDLDLTDQFLAACMSANVAVVSGMLAKNPGIVNTLSPTDLDTITEAAAAGRTDAVRIMLDAGFPIIGSGDPTPLHQAAWFGMADTVTLLLQRGASKDVTEPHYGGKALDWARHNSGSLPDKNAAVISLLTR